MNATDAAPIATLYRPDFRAPTAMEMADRAEVDASIHNYHDARERARVHRVLMDRNGIAVLLDDGKVMAKDCALSHLLMHLGSLRPSHPAMQLARGFVRAALGQADDAQLANMARQFGAALVQLGADLVVPALDDGESPCVRFEVEGENGNG